MNRHGRGCYAGIHADSVLYMDGKLYTPPELDVLWVCVEHGYRVSGNDDEGGMGLPGWEII